MPITDEHLLRELDALLSRQQARVDGLSTRATALTGFMAAAATLVLGRPDSTWRDWVVTSYAVAAGLGVLIMFGRLLSHRPERQTILRLWGADEPIRLRNLEAEKAKSAAVNGNRLRLVEWSWRAHIATVLVSLVLTALYVRSL